LEKEDLYQYIRSMITSSTHQPKFMSISTVKVADLLGISISQVESCLNELIEDGRLTTSKLEQPPYKEVYMLQ
jgi:DNA-binding transcriptional MocR family regulator